MQQAERRAFRAFERWGALALLLLNLVAGLARVSGSLREASPLLLHLGTLFWDLVVFSGGVLGLGLCWRWIRPRLLLAEVKGDWQLGGWSARAGLCVKLGLLAVLSFLVIAKGADIAATRLAFHRHAAERAETVSLYLEAIGLQEAGDLDGALRLYERVSQTGPRRIIGRSAQEQSVKLTYSLDRAVKSFQRGQLLAESPERLLYGYWDLADALSLDPMNAIYRRELEQRHREIAELIEAFAARVALPECRLGKKGLPAIGRDKRYKSIVGATLYGDIVNKGPLLEMTCSMSREESVRFLQRRTWFEEVAVLLEAHGAGSDL